MWCAENSVPILMKQNKLRRLEHILKPEFLSCRRGDKHFDCLDDATRSKFNVEEESGLSENAYHVPALQMIEKYKHGLVLDVGAGKRNTYYGNVVNLDINKYESTDVVAVAERLPFWDNVFDAVHSNAMLEHVVDPFLCAKEMVRVLKPGGEIICCVPFLQPFHACPHHYYNMTSEGLKNLFVPDIKVQAVEVYDNLRPITSLKLLATDYASGLVGNTKELFMDMSVRDLINMPYTGFRDMGIVTELDAFHNRKMACCHTLFGTKRGPPSETQLVIVSAKYGSERKWRDFTEKIQAMVVDNQLTISTDTNINSLFGDPAEGEQKKLTLQWQQVSSLDGNVLWGGTTFYEEIAGRLRTPVILSATS